MIASSVDQPGDSTPKASGKNDLGEPQYGVPAVSTRATRLPPAPSMNARMNRPP